MPYTEAARGTGGRARPGSERSFKAQGAVELPAPAPGHHWECVFNPEKGRVFLAFVEVSDGAL